MNLFRTLVLSLALAGPAVASAETLSTPAGELEVPEGFLLLDRNEEPAADGSPNGLYVFGREVDPLPRAIYIVTFAKPLATAGNDLPDSAKAAAIMADPTDTTPDFRRTKEARIGEASGHRHSTVLSNGLVSTVYAVDHNGLRLMALLKHPAGKEYERDTARFERALQEFRWAAPAEAAAVVPPETTDTETKATPAAVDATESPQAGDSAPAATDAADED